MAKAFAIRLAEHHFANHPPVQWYADRDIQRPRAALKLMLLYSAGVKSPGHVENHFYPCSFMLKLTMLWLLERRTQVIEHLEIDVSIS